MAYGSFDSVLQIVVTVRRKCDSHGSYGVWEVSYAAKYVYMIAPRSTYEVQIRYGHNYLSSTICACVMVEVHVHAFMYSGKIW